MQNIFLELKQKSTLKREPLEKLLDIDPEEDEEHPLTPVLDGFFQGARGHKEAINLILSLLEKTQSEVREKLLAVLVFFLSKVTADQVLPVIAKVCKNIPSTASRARFLSLVFKSLEAQAVRKQVIKRSVELLEGEGKLSIFSNFIETFPHLINSVTWTGNERAELYLRLVNFIGKHVVYKKLWKKYIVLGLMGISKEQANSSATDQLMIQLLGSGEVPGQALGLLSHSDLKQNKFYPFLEALLEGDQDAFGRQDQKALSAAGVNTAELQRRVKIQSIPRVLGGIKQASYEQVGHILKVSKDDVQSYIIEAIQQGLLQAKIDEFHQTIIIKSVNLRTLRAQEKAALQKRMSDVASQLEGLAS